MKTVKHSLFSFTIEQDAMPGRFLKRDLMTGAVEVATSLEYMLGLLVMKAYPEDESVEPSEAIATPVETPAKVNLNTADAEAIASLPSFGATAAAKIVQNRDDGPYTDLDDVLKRCGLNLTNTKRKELADKVEF